jgi:hypothetical protein
MKITPNPLPTISLTLMRAIICGGTRLSHISSEMSKDRRVNEIDEPEVSDSISRNARQEVMECVLWQDYQRRLRIGKLNIRTGHLVGLITCPHENTEVKL